MKKTAILIFFLSFAARLWYLQDVGNTPLFFNPIVDSGDYDRVSASLASGEKILSDFERPHRLPFYQVFLSSIYRFSGHNIYIACVIQALIGAMVSLVLMAVSAMVFSHGAGVIAGIIYALYWPAIAFTGKTLPVNLALFFAVSAVFCLAYFLRSGKKAVLFLAGLSMACAALSQANLALYFPAAAIMLLFPAVRPIGLSRRFKEVLILSAGFFILIGPLTLKDFTKRKELMPIQENYSIVAYIGADIEHVKIKPGSTYRRIMREMLEKDLVTLKDRNRFWLRKTWDYIKENPLRYIRNTGQKIYLLFNGYEFSPRECINFFRASSGFLSLPLFNMGMIAPLGILGAVLAYRKKEALVPEIFLIVSFLSLLPFSPFARFKLILAPFVIIFAGFFIFRIYEMVRQRQAKNMIIPLCLLAGLMVLTNTDPFMGQLNQFDRPLYHVGLAYKKTGDYDKALYYEREALKKHPHDADILEAIGDTFMKRGEDPKALHAYRMSLRNEPKFPEVQEKTAVLIAQSGDLSGAEKILADILKGYPTEVPSTHINLGNCYFFQKRYKAAETEYSRAIEIAPENLQPYYRLLDLYDTLKDPRSEKLREKIIFMGGRP